MRGPCCKAGCGSGVQRKAEEKGWTEEHPAHPLQEQRTSSCRKQLNISEPEQGEIRSELQQTSLGRYVGNSSHTHQKKKKKKVMWSPRVTTKDIDTA